MNDVQNGFVVSILELGAWAGSWIVGYFADRISRKYSIVLFCVIFLLGSSIVSFPCWRNSILDRCLTIFAFLQQGGAQTINYLYGGRFVTGMAVGALSMLVPLYQSEIAPPEFRGSLVSLQQLAVTLGILISFWIDFGTQYIPNEAQWRIPFCLQIAIGLVLGFGILFFPFSPRWLMSVDREDEALKVIGKLRRLPIDHPLVMEEWREIKASVEFERQVQADMYPQYVNQGTKGKVMMNVMGYVDLFRKGMLLRLFLACAIMFFQQFVGVNALIYYAPKIFQSVGLTGTTVSLLATGVVGIINFVMTIPTVLFLDKFGRKPMLMTASAIMTVCMVIIAIIVALFQHDWPNHTAEGWVCVAFVYIFIANFAYSWGPIGWVYGSEIFPLRVRAKAMSISTSANWMCSKFLLICRTSIMIIVYSPNICSCSLDFIIAQITPPMLGNITYGTYIFFACFCFISFFFVWFLVPETKGRSLEEMDEIFGGSSALRDAELMNKVQHEISQKNIPGLKAGEAV